MDLLPFIFFLQCKVCKSRIEFLFPEKREDKAGENNKKLRTLRNTFLIGAKIATQIKFSLSTNSSNLSIFFFDRIDSILRGERIMAKKKKAAAKRAPAKKKKPAKKAKKR